MKNKKSKKKTIMIYDVFVEMSYNNVTMFRAKATKTSILKGIASCKEYVEDAVIEAIVKRLDKFIAFAKKGMVGNPPIIDIVTERSDAMLYYTKVLSKS